MHRAAVVFTLAFNDAKTTKAMTTLGAFIFLSHHCGFSY